jgi:phosphoribosylaminoimidazole-succinocarboxamide synthase
VTILETSIPDVPLFNRGKVRDTYDIGEGRLLMVATDRISAFDVVLPTAIPDKGHVLAHMSKFWFERTEDVVPNHFIRLVTSTEGNDDLPFTAPQELVGRAMIIRKAERVDIECIARGYISGSAWAEYQKSGEVCGIRLPAGLEESQELPEPIFTPSTKEETGHDRNISFEELVSIVGPKTAGILKVRTMALYRYAADYARERGIIIADTKFEFGWLADELIVIDEILTPDSSRFWPADEYRTGRSQPSFDKQYVRDWLSASGWDHEPPAPELPPDVVAKTAEKYREAYERLTGETLP